MLGKYILLFLVMYVSLCNYLVCYSQNQNIDYLTELKTRKDFDNLKGKPLSHNYNGIECVKLVYDIATKKLFYLESKKYKWHYQFTAKILNDKSDVHLFNSLNYGSNPNRKYILATFNYNTSNKNYFLQFAPPDDISEELITTLVNKITETFYKKNQFKVLLNTTTLLRRKKQLTEQFNTITSDELYKSQKFQSIYAGKSSGVLTFIDADSIKESVDYSNCILVINGNSNEIPVCRGIITNQFQTPLSHICLLSINRKTPCAFQKNSFENDSLRKMNHQYVEISVTESTVLIKPIQESKDKILVRKKIKLLCDTTTKSISDLKLLSIKHKNSYGSKTCNLAELQALERKTHKIKTPDNAFAIPFYYYHQHIKKNQIDTLIQNLLEERSVLKNDSLLAVHLKKIRKEIMKSKMDSALLNRVSVYCMERFGNKKVRFRSSSNCEDSDNFNGAGLYTSVSGKSNDSLKTYETAIKKVWASLWNIRAFKERDYFNIDHSHVLMGILVHEAFDDELINGVAVTKNLYRNYEAGFVINIQKGEEEVVSPRKGIISEQLISYMNLGFDFYDKNRSADWLSYSSLHPNASLLTIEELKQLTQQLESIKWYFYKLYKLESKVEYKKFGMDVEFKLIETADKKRSFMIKQVRPYIN